MRTLVFAIVAISLMAIQADETPEKAVNPLSRGWSDGAKWVPWDDAIETALEQNKPILLLVHKEYCQACKSLKKLFEQKNAQKAFLALSEFFVVTNTEDNEEPEEEEYKPDGSYSPRVLFLDKRGDVMEQFSNQKAEYKNYKYYYANPSHIFNTMKDVIKHYGKEVPQLRSTNKLIPANQKKEL
uniref:Thioredoxin domain-containing protein n=1 Tax=Rhabditophanes sp. KR3021 TaxID=114890 RepID=A0AC35TJ42_9BILA